MSQHFVKLLLALCIVGIAGFGLWQLRLAAHDTSSPPAKTDDTATGTINDEAFKTAFAKASAKHGHAIAQTCKDCHTFDDGGPTRLGPNLYGVFGAHHAWHKEYPYSDALKAMKDKIWTAENLNRWLSGPKRYAPGTKMGYPGVADLQDRADLILYLKKLKETE